MAEEKSLAIVGRPNVGKSRLFNRLLGRRVSIVHDRPGVTRDIVVEKLSGNLLLMDTGGMFATPDMTESVIIDATNRQANFAVDAADEVVLVTDSQEGLAPLDIEIAKILRESGKRVIVAVNKVDMPQHSARAAEFYSLGFTDVVEVSAEHGYGIDKLLSLVERDFGKIETPADDGCDRIKICVAGRPNVGKSSIANRLLGEEKMIVSQIAGTTRDTVKFDIDAQTKKGEPMRFRLYDTAGLKTRGKTNSSLDFLSSLRTRRAVESCDAVFLVLDSMGGVTELDKKLAGEISAAGASVIIVVNKWDYAEEAFKKEPLRGYKDIREFGTAFDESVRKALNFVGGSKIFFTSATRNKGVDKLLYAAFRVYNKANAPVTTGKLNAAVRGLIDKNPPKYLGGKRFKVYYCVKTLSRPWTLRLYCNSAGALSPAYKKYLVNGIREKFDLGGVSICVEAVGKKSQTAEERIANKKSK